MRFKAFKNRYWIFLKQKQALKNDSSIEDCKVSKMFQNTEKTKLLVWVFKAAAWLQIHQNYKFIMH